MKRFKKILAMVIAMAMVLGMGTAVGAQTVTVGTTDKGSITISNATVDKAYSIYKLFDATVTEDGSGISYTLPAGKTITGDAAGWFEVTTIGTVSTVTAKDALNETVLKSDAFKTWAQSFGTQVGETVTATDSTVKFDKIPFGYYYVTSSLGVAITVDSTTPDATVIDKNQIPSWDNGDSKPGKVIIENGQKVSSNEANLNEDVTFDIGVDATNYNNDKQILKYIIYDEMDPGMSYKLDSMTVKVGETTLTAGTTGYTVTYYDADGTAISPVNATTIKTAQSFRVEIPWVTTTGTAPDVVHTSKYESPVEIHVQYVGFLDGEKVDEVNINTDPNLNKADFDWVDTEDDNDNPDKDHPNHENPEKQTKTFTTKLVIHKTDENGDALTGAEFTLTGTTYPVAVGSSEVYEEDENGTYWKLADGNYTTDDPTEINPETGDPKYDPDDYASTTTKYSKKVIASNVITPSEDVNIKASVDDEGNLTFSGLADGTYTISETVVPTGYNKAADITFTISHTTSGEIGAQTVTFASDNEDVSLDGTNSFFETTIENNKGQELPSTGGIGTTIFYVVGAILVIGAGVVMITRRRMDA